MFDAAVRHPAVVEVQIAQPVKTRQLFQAAIADRGIPQHQLFERLESRQRLDRALAHRRLWQYHGFQVVHAGQLRDGVIAKRQISLDPRGAPLAHLVDQRIPTCALLCRTCTIVRRSARRRTSLAPRGDKNGQRCDSSNRDDPAVRNRGYRG